MRKFNVMIVAAWLTIFFCSLFNTSGLDYATLEETGGIYGLAARVNMEVNDFVWGTFHSATLPDDPVIVKHTMSDGTTVYQEQQGYNNSLDNRITQTVLRNTFVPLLLTVLALNFAFYAGRGDIGRLGGNLASWTREKVWRQQILFRYREYRSRMKTERKERDETKKYHDRLAEERQLG